MEVLAVLENDLSASNLIFFLCPSPLALPLRNDDARNSSGAP